MATKAALEMQGSITAIRALIGDRAGFRERRIMDAPRIPHGMIQVDQEKFYALLYAEKRDIMPSVDYPEYTTWKAGPHVWGWSVPGWRNPGEPKVYAVASEVVN